MSDESLPTDDEAIRNPPKPSSLLDCRLETLSTLGQVVFVVGHPDGVVQELVLNEADARQLTGQLAMGFRPPPTKKTPVYGTREWFALRSVLRAKAKAQGDGIEVIYEDAKRVLSTVVDYVDDELKSLRKLVSRRGRSMAKPQTVVDRARRIILTTIEAMRTDT